MTRSTHTLAAASERIGHGHASREPAVSPPPTLRRLADAAGLAFNGAQPWDIHVRDDTFYGRVLRQGSLGLGEAYVDGLWDSACLDETLARLIRAGTPQRLRGLGALPLLVGAVRHGLS
jgi:cyclopropane-fatty-acyl-phospholipid synthase